MVKIREQLHSGSNLNAGASKNYSWKWKLNTRRRRFRLAPNPILPRYASSEASEQNSASTSTPAPPLLQLMKYEIPVVLVLLTLKYQGKTESVFKDNPVALWCFFAATFGYWLIVGAMKDLISCDWIQTLRRAALASALVSAISLVCIFLPYPASLVPLAFVVTSPVSFVVLYALNLVIEWAVNKMHVVLVWARSRVMSTEGGEEEGEVEGC